MRAFLRANGTELPMGQIVEFLLTVRNNLKQGVRKPVAIEMASDQINTHYRTGRRLWDKRYIWLKKGR